MSEEQQPEQPEQQIQTPCPVVRQNQALEELKHSIHTHITIMNGPSQQLAAFLVKIVDFIDDADQDRRDKEMASLSYVIIEALAVYIQQAVDNRANTAKNQARDFPSHIKQAGDNLLVVIGQNRGLDDKIVAKNFVLKSMANALRELSSFTKATYPTITDSKRQEL